MDYMAELAEHPDIHTALKLVRDDATIALGDDAELRPVLSALVGDEPATGQVRPLARSHDLRTQHPHAWITEVIHAFYRYPQIAAEAWKKLRYCDAFLRLTAEKMLEEKASTWRRISPVLPPEVLDVVDSKSFHKWKHGAISEAVQQVLLRLAKRPMIIDVICKHPPFRPHGPRFLEDLLRAAHDTEPTADEKIAELLREPDKVRRKAEECKITVPFTMVLDQELDQIVQTRDLIGRSQQHDPNNGGHPLRRALGADLLGLAFSGGGIRSATFNLGVLQTLARIGLLKECDYLSTVSGGGYIGSWFAAWLRRESYNPGRSPREALDELLRRLSPTRSPNPMDQRERPIRYLREYSNYLTPRAGLMSADTWTMVGIYLRNLLLNQVIIVSLTAAALLVPRVWFACLQRLADNGLWLGVIGFVFGALCLILNLRRLEPRSAAADLSTHYGPSHAADLEPRLYATPFGIQVGVVLPWLLGASLLVHYFVLKATAACVWAGATAGYICDYKPVPLLSEAPLSVMAGTFLLFGGTLTVGRVHRSWLLDKPDHERRNARLFAASAIFGAALIAACLAGCLSWAVLRGLFSLSGTQRDNYFWHFTLLGPAALMSVLSIATIGMLGVLGRHFPDEHREWWSRLRTFMHVWSVTGIVWAALSLYVPWAFRDYELGLQSILTAVATWFGSTYFGVRAAQASETDDRKARTNASLLSRLSDTLMSWATFAAPYACILGLLVIASVVIDSIYRGALPRTVPFLATDYFRFATWTAVPELVWSSKATELYWGTLAVMGGLIAVGTFFSLRVDINEFSIHHFYRNRLVRCYLGASHEKRKADWFTGFDPRDDLPLSSFDHRAPGAKSDAPSYPGPYPIFNCALNLVGGQDLAWQERKASSFVFTPKYCGYDLDRAVLRKSDDGVLQSEAYVPTSIYHNDRVGPPLGMVMAISGAAANPNMGRATTSASAFLMTVFNVRLGWWIKNPRRRKTMSPSPLFGLTYTFLELLGGTNDRGRYINLSDGGHFDNLGVYELIRRGCRYIIASDAGQDGSLSCEDLGNVIRKCRTDFGVEIDISVDRIRERSPDFSATHCVVGKIHYLNIPRRNDKGQLVDEYDKPIRNGTRPAHEVGYLVYLKPSMTGDEPQDVQEYFRRIPEFPHQTTADQWFSESQFESYRKLGMHIAEETFGRYVQEADYGVREMNVLFSQLHRYWYPADVSIGRHAGSHAKAYARILEQLRGHSDLHSLDHTIFEGLPPFQDAKLPRRDELYLCGALLNLMHDVYVDLDLERNWQHPHVEGWMRLFERWAKQPAFERTWRISELTYAKRFRSFYRDRLRRRTLPLPAAFRGVRYPGCPQEVLKTLVSQQSAVLLLTVVQADNKELLAQGSASQVPLASCLKDLHAQTQLVIDVTADGTEQALFEALRAAHWRLRDYVVIADCPKRLRHFQKHAKNARLGYKVKCDCDLKATLDRVSSEPDLKLDFLTAASDCLTSTQLDLIKQSGLPVIGLDVDVSMVDGLTSHECVAGVFLKAGEVPDQPGPSRHPPADQASQVY